MAIYHLFYVCRLVCATLPSLQAPWCSSRAQTGRQMVLAPHFMGLGYWSGKPDGKLCKHPFPFPMCFPPSKFPVLRNFPNVPHRNWIHDQGKRERGHNGCILVLLAPGNYFLCIGGNFRMVRILEKPEPAGSLREQQGSLG